MNKRHIMRKAKKQLNRRQRLTREKKLSAMKLNCENADYNFNTDSSKQYRVKVTANKEWKPEDAQV